MVSIKTTLYDIARQLNKIAGVMTDIDVIKSGDPKKIAKRFAKKVYYKEANKIGKKL